jgi:hypothetical protein
MPQTKGIISGDVIVLMPRKSSAAAATTIVSITIVKLSHLKTINTQVCIADSIPRSVTTVSVMLVHGD